MNNLYYFEIQASDPQKAIKFYTEVFGWKFAKQEGVPVEYYSIEGGGVPGGLLKRPTQTPPPGFGTNAFVCSFQVESFDRTATVILGNGGKVAMEKFAVPGKCWQGYFIDTEGNTFGLFEVDEKAG